MTSITQPGGIQMQQSGLPEALSYLASLDQVIVKQKKELLEIVTGFETANRYEVMNSMKQQIFFVQEESGFCMRQCCHEDRGFILHFYDNSNQEVMRVTREFRCCVGCCWCADGSCGFIVQVEAPVGNVVGYVKQANSKWKFHANIEDAQHRPLYTIWGPCCPCQTICCRADVDFPITTMDEKNVVGRIAKQWTGILTEMITDADTFSVTFPVNMPIPEKATTIGALFLIDFMLFESAQNNNHHH